MTDGAPTDDPTTWARACQTARDHESRRKVMIFPIGVGEAKMAKLSELSTTPPKQLVGTKFRELFEWIGNSVSVYAKSVPGEDVKLPDTDPWAYVKLK
jgi:uncharacterized protein YegL